ncbi:MAG: hypothetical protein GX121_01620 [Ignavibacteria bacterium]|jgi:RNA-binding protein YhbY|nr:hypothetical protein [Ignavibacteria bacterium]
MESAINIAENENTLFLAIDKERINNFVIEQVSSILSDKRISKVNIEQVDDEEQAEIEAILDAMTEEDKEIVRTERIYIEL